MKQSLEAAYREFAANNLAVIVDARRTTRRALDKAAASFRPTPEREMRLASLYIPAQLYLFLRRHGLDPERLPPDQRASFVESLTMEWANRFVDDHPQLGLDRERIRMRVLLQRVSRTGVSHGKNALRAAMERYAKSGQAGDLEYGAREAQRSVGAAGRWAATIDVCAIVLGEHDQQVVEHRQRLDNDTAELDDILIRARPLLVEHGLADDLYPVDE